MFGLPQLAVGEVETTGVDDNFSLAIDLSGITAWTPRHLIFHIRTKQATGNLPAIGIQFNGDTDDHYQWFRSQGSGNDGLAYSDVNTNAGGQADDRDVRVSRMEVGYAQETNWTHVIGMVVDAFSTRSVKYIRWMSYMPEESGTTGHIYQGVGKWDSYAIITSVELDAAENVDAGSRIELAVVDESYNIDETILTSNAVSKSGRYDNDGAFNTNNTGAISAGNGDLCMVGNFSIYQENSSFIGYNDELQDYSSPTYWFSRKSNQKTYVGGGADDHPRIGWAAHDTTYAAGQPYEDYELHPNITLIPDYATGTHDRGAVTWSAQMDAYIYGFAEYGNTTLYNTRWASTDAITEVQIDSGWHVDDPESNWVAGSMCSFYKVTDDYNLIERKEISTDTASFDVTIPDTYDHIEITWTARSDVGGASSILMGEMSQYLGDSGGVDTTDTNYANRVYRHNGANGNNNESTGSYTGGANMGEVATTDADTNVFSTGWNMIFDYNESVHKTSIGLGGVVENNDTYSTCGYKATSWHDNDAVTTLRIQAATGDLVAGSVFTIRGVTSDDAPSITFIPETRMF
jgi:hypothetical protein